MKRVALWSLFFGVALGLRAQTPDAEFLQIYNLIQEGESLEAAGQPSAAMQRFQHARQDLTVFAKANPTWNERIIKFRLDFLTHRLGSLKEKIPAPSEAAPSPASASGSALPGDAPQAAALTPRSGDVMSRADSLSLELASARTRADAAESRASAAESKVEYALRKSDDLAVKLSDSNDRTAQLALDLRQARDRVDVLEASATNLEKTKERLDREHSTLEARLREALSPKAAAIDPAELARAEDRILLLVKENEILKAGLDHQMDENKRIVEKARKAIELEQQLEATRTELAGVKRQSEELRGDRQKLQVRLDGLGRKSEEQNTALKGEIETLKKDLATARAGGKSPVANDVGRELAALRADLSAQRSLSDTLRRENEALVREIEKLTDIRVTPASLKVAEVPLAETSPSDLARMRRLERERDELRKELDEARSATLRRPERETAASPADGRVRDLTHQVTRLQARLGALEAKPEPYTPEELALFKAPAQRTSLPALPPVLMAQATQASPTADGSKSAPAAPPSSASGASTNLAPPAGSASETVTNKQAISRRRTARDLPPGANMLAEQARRAFAQRRLEDAERAYRDILKLDENNVFTLGNLAAIVVEQGRTEEGEVLLKRSLALDPQDPFSLSLMGILRFRQQRYDDAFAALSEAARLDPEDPATQTYLGITLSERGQRPAAEAALRKALKLNPTSAAAHYNLAVVYATQKPAFLELARFHYEKSRRAGQPANPAFEAVLRGEAAAPAPAPASPKP